MYEARSVIEMQRCPSASVLSRGLGLHKAEIYEGRDIGTYIQNAKETIVSETPFYFSLF